MPCQKKKLPFGYLLTFADRYRPGPFDRMVRDWRLHYRDIKKMLKKLNKARRALENKLVETPTNVSLIVKQQAVVAKMRELRIEVGVMEMTRQKLNALEERLWHDAMLARMQEDSDIPKPPPPAKDA